MLHLSPRTKNDIVYLFSRASGFLLNKNCLQYELIRKNSISSVFTRLPNYHYQFNFKLFKNDPIKKIILFNINRKFSICISHSQVKKSEKEKSAFSELIQSEKNNNQVSTHLSGVKRVKQVATDFSYTGIILLGGLMLISIGYYLFSELFSRENPSGIYNESSKFCLKNYEIQEALGSPIKVTAESGGRRVFQIKHKYFIENNDLYLIINYYLEGPKNKGTVFCKVKKNPVSEKFEYEHIIVKLDYPHHGVNRITVKTKEDEPKN